MLHNAEYTLPTIPYNTALTTKITNKFDTMSCKGQA